MLTRLESELVLGLAVASIRCQPEAKDERLTDKLACSCQHLTLPAVNLRRVDKSFAGRFNEDTIDKPTGALNNVS